VICNAPPESGRGYDTISIFLMLLASDEIPVKDMLANDMFTEQ